MLSGNQISVRCRLMVGWCIIRNTPGTRGGLSGGDRTLAIKRRKTPDFFLNLSSSYENVGGETNFQPREIPRSGSKAKDGKDTPGTKTEHWP